MATHCPLKGDRPFMELGNLRLAVCTSDLAACTDMCHVLQTGSVVETSCERIEQHESRTSAALAGEAAPNARGWRAFSRD
jgi:hypothetical protein